MFTPSSSKRSRTPPTRSSSCPGSTAAACSRSSPPTCATPRWSRTASPPATSSRTTSSPTRRGSRRCAQHPQGRDRRPAGGQRLQRRDHQRRAAGGRPEHRRAPRLHRGRGSSRKVRRSSMPHFGGLAGRRPHHRLRQGGRRHRRGRAARPALLRHRLRADHRCSSTFYAQSFRLALIVCSAPRRRRLAARAPPAARLRHRPDVDPGAVPDLRHRRQPRRADGQRQRLRDLPTPTALSAARIAFRRLLRPRRHRADHRHDRLPHHPRDPDPGDPGDRHGRQPRRRRDPAHQPGPAARGALLRPLPGGLPREARAAGAAHGAPLVPLARVTERRPRRSSSRWRSRSSSSVVEGQRRCKIGDLHAGVPELRADSRYNLDTAVITSKLLDRRRHPHRHRRDQARGLRRLRGDDHDRRFSWRMATSKACSRPSSCRRRQDLNAGWNEGSPKWRVLSRNPSVLTQSVAYVDTATGLLNSDCSVMPVMMFTADHKAETIDRIVAEVKDSRPRTDSDVPSSSRPATSASWRRPTRRSRRRSSDARLLGLRRGGAALPDHLPLAARRALHPAAARRSSRCSPTR
jgi:hypothetical protein